MPTQTSNCCNAEIKTHIAYEGTGCYVCTKCGKACDQMTSNEEKIVKALYVDWAFKDGHGKPDKVHIEGYPSGGYHLSYKEFIERIDALLHSQKERVVEMIEKGAQEQENMCVKEKHHPYEGNSCVYQYASSMLSDLKNKIEETL